MFRIVFEFIKLLQAYEEKGFPTFHECFIEFQARSSNLATSGYHLPNFLDDKTLSKCDDMQSHILINRLQYV